MKEKAQPKFHKATPVLHTMREKAETELTRLQEENIIRKVEHSDWSAPIVVEPKANKTVRICGDFKVTINPNVEQEHYPLPSMEDLFASLATTLCDREHSQGNISLPAYAIRGKQGSKYLPVDYGSDPAGYGSCHVLPR